VARHPLARVGSVVLAHRTAWAPRAAWACQGGRRRWVRLVVRRGLGSRWGRSVRQGLGVRWVAWVRRAAALVQVWWVRLVLGSRWVRWVLRSRWVQLVVRRVSGSRWVR